jgi:hypothetical protein
MREIGIALNDFDKRLLAVLIKKTRFYGEI